MDNTDRKLIGAFMLVVIILVIHFQIQINKLHNSIIIIDKTNQEFINTIIVKHFNNK